MMFYGRRTLRHKLTECSLTPTQSGKMVALLKDNLMAELKNKFSWNIYIDMAITPILHFLYFTKYPRHIHLKFSGYTVHLNKNHPFKWWGQIYLLCVCFFFLNKNNIKKTSPRTDIKQISLAYWASEVLTSRRILC